jgi:hypothetical protein
MYLLVEFTITSANTKNIYLYLQVQYIRKTCYIRIPALNMLGKYWNG